MVIFICYILDDYSHRVEFSSFKKNVKNKFDRGEYHFNLGYSGVPWISSILYVPFKKRAIIRVLWLPEYHRTIFDFPTPVGYWDLFSKQQSQRENSSGNMLNIIYYCPWGFCRGAIIATAISTIIFFSLYTKNKGGNFNLQKFTSVSVILIFIAIAVIYFSNILTFGKTFHKISILFSKGLNERLPLWTGAINAIFSNPINGVGLGNYVLPDKVNAHNEILQIGAETGMTGLFGLSVFSIVVFKQIRHNFSLIKIPEVKLLHTAIIAGCIATLIQSSVSYNLHSSASSFLFFAGLGILCANKAEIEHQSQSRKTIPNAVIIFLVAFLSLWSIRSEYNMIAGHYTYNKAQSFFLKNNISESLRYSLKAIHYKPRDPRYHLLVSRSYLKNKNLELAEKHYQIAETLSIISPDKDLSIKSR